MPENGHDPKDALIGALALRVLSPEQFVSAWPAEAPRLTPLWVRGVWEGSLPPESLRAYVRFRLEDEQLARSFSREMEEGMRARARFALVGLGTGSVAGWVAQAFLGSARVGAAGILWGLVGFMCVWLVETALRGYFLLHSQKQRSAALWATWRGVIAGALHRGAGPRGPEALDPQNQAGRVPQR